MKNSSRNQGKMTTARSRNVKKKYEAEATRQLPGHPLTATERAAWRKAKAKK